MKPYSDTVQRTAKRGVGSAKKKKAAVQKSIAKAKVTAVKTQRKLTTSKASKEEIEDLLDISVATPVKPKTAAAKTATKPKPPLAKTAVPKKSVKSPPKKNAASSVSKMEKIKSMVNMSNGHSKLKASPSVATPTRRSARTATVASTAATNGSGTNGHHSADVSMAEEALEDNQNSGFLKKTISKIWTKSTSSLNGAQQQQQEQPPQESSSGGGGGCVIS